MIVPYLADDEFLADVARTRADSDALHIWWLGQSGFLVQWQGRHLILDPYLSDSLTRKYAGTDKPHTRMTGRVVAPERLDFVEVATSSHNHTDHLDAETLGPLLSANPGLAIIVPEANRSFAAQRLGVEPASLIGLDAGAQAVVAGFTVVGVPAAHERLERDTAGHHLFLGYVVRCGPWTLYHSGDSVRFPNMAELLIPHAVDVAILPINGSRPERKVAGNLDGAEAAQLAHDMDAGVVVPCHYEMFEFNTASPHPFAEACRRLNQGYRILRAGERYSLR